MRIVTRCPGCRKRHYQEMDPTVTWVICNKCGTPVPMRPQATDEGEPERQRRVIDTLGST